MFAVVDQYGQSTLRYRNAKFGNGIIDMFVFSTMEAAKAKLDSWMSNYSRAEIKSEADELANYTENQEYFADQGINSFEAYCKAFFSNGAGWYDINGGFIGELNETHYNLGDNSYYIVEVDVKKEED